MFVLANISFWTSAHCIITVASRVYCWYYCHRCYCNFNSEIHANCWSQLRKHYKHENRSKSVCVSERVVLGIRVYCDSNVPNTFPLLYVYTDIVSNLPGWSPFNSDETNTHSTQNVMTRLEQLPGVIANWEQWRQQCAQVSTTTTTINCWLTRSITTFRQTFAQWRADSQSRSVLETFAQQRANTQSPSVWSVTSRIV
jgi:hypothetical protein